MEMRMRNNKDITFSIFICISPRNEFFLFLEYLVEDFNEMELMNSNHFPINMTWITLEIFRVYHFQKITQRLYLYLSK